jgi:hypothetical protein
MHDEARVHREGSAVLGQDRVGMGVATKTTLPLQQRHLVGIAHYVGCGETGDSGANNCDAGFHAVSIHPV